MSRPIPGEDRFLQEATQAVDAVLPGLRGPERAEKISEVAGYLTQLVQDLYGRQPSDDAAHPPSSAESADQ